MALSTTQKAAIYRFLGYSDRAQSVEGKLSQRIQQALEGLSSPIETEVTTLLGSSAATATSNTHKDCILLFLCFQFTENICLLHFQLSIKCLSFSARSSTFILSHILSQLHLSHFKHRSF